MVQSCISLAEVLGDAETWRGANFLPFSALMGATSGGWCVGESGGASTYKEDVKAPWFSHAALGFCHISVLACPMMSEFWLACGKQQEIYAFALFSLVIDIYLAGGLDLCCIANNYMKTIITIWRLWGHNKKKLGPDWNLSTTTEKHFYYAVLTVTAIRWQYELLIFKSKSKL